MKYHSLHAIKSENERKKQIQDFWNEKACGENLYFKGDNDVERFRNQSKARYELEPYILTFAEFEKSNNKKVLEVGVGLGADHQLFADKGAELYGCDLTERAIEMTRRRFQLFNLTSELKVANAENLPYPSNYFDIVYSWGVIHHSPNTQEASNEILRVLKKGGVGKIMIYHKKSMVGFMLWIRYAFLTFKPFRTLEYIYANYLESPRTKAYTIKEAKELFNKFRSVEIETILTHGDLLTSKAGQRHEGFILNIARKIYPRFVVKSIFPKNGLFMLVNLKK